MKSAKPLIPANDAERLAALHRYRLADTGPEEAFDNITALMAHAFDAPLSFISLVDEGRVFYKSSFGGFPHPSVLREDSLCSHTILGTGPLVIENAKDDPCFREGPYVASEGGIRFYAGVPLVTQDGFAIGTVCVVDTKPRVFPEASVRLLERFARMAMHEIEMRAVLRRQAGSEGQLKESNEELRFVTDLIPQLVWATHPDGYSYYFNSRWLEYTGLTFDDVKGDGWTKSLHPDDYEPTLAAWREAIGQAAAYDVEYRLRRHDGVYRWFMARGTPMKDGTGKVMRWYGTTTDIDDQKRAEEALEEKIQERTRELQQQSLFANSVLDASINAVMVLDAIWGKKGEVEDFRFLKINNAFTRIVGLDESILGKNYRSYFPGTSSSGVFNLYARVLKTGQPERKEIYSADQDLNSWFDVSAVKRGDNGVVVTFNNISPQRQAAIRIEQQKNLLDQILQHSPSGISVTEVIRDASGNVVDARTIIANEVSAKHSGLPLDLALSKTVCENLPGILESPLFVQALHTLRTGEPFITQYFVEPTGRWIELAVARMDEDRLINVFTDVTPIKEAQLKQEELVARLKRSNEELEQFTYVSHHDLQEPLRKIMMFTDMVKADPGTQLSEAAATRLEKVTNAARRMSAALRDVLNYASLSREERSDAVDLDEVLAAVQSDLELVITEKKARITSDALPTINAVPHQMHQLFYNLVNNALKFARPGEVPDVQVRCRIPGLDELRRKHPELDATRSWYELSFADNGIGFSPEAAEKIFVMFQRLHQKDTFAGTGIGLALCRKVAQNHGGKIWAESAPGAGATFTILLPE
ncbi:MAG: PAS domain S-box protein [Chitinophagaceae bacterium]|nr:MAG: PAS domain S-box protein [Chitinophagaceae bacterium]